MNEPFRPLPWERQQGEDMAAMPVMDYTDGPCCKAAATFTDKRWACTAPMGHGGHHRAGTISRRLVAEWEA